MHVQHFGARSSHAAHAAHASARGKPSLLLPRNAQFWTKRVGIIQCTSTQSLTRVVKFLLCSRRCVPLGLLPPPLSLGRRVVVVFHGYSTSKRPLLPPSLFLSAPLGKREETDSPIVLHGGCYRRVFCTLKALRGRVVWRRKRATFWQFTIFAECLWRGGGRQREKRGESSGAKEKRHFTILKRRQEKRPLHAFSSLFLFRSEARRRRQKKG